MNKFQKHIHGKLLLSNNRLVVMRFRVHRAWCGTSGLAVGVIGVGGDVGRRLTWLAGEGMDKRNPRRQGSSIKFPSSSTLTTFTNMTHALPVATGNHPQASYTLKNALGTISKYENHTFAWSWNGVGNYPTNQQVWFHFSVVVSLWSDERPLDH